MNRRAQSFNRLLVANLLIIFLLPVAISAPRAVKGHRSFAALSNRLSEPGGYFDSDNLISNETSYLHVLAKLRELEVSNGVYIGVGPDQNFTYISKIRPRMAIIIDIRRDNMLQHLLFKALFARSRNRMEYLCNFFGKPYPKNKGWEQKPVKELADYIDGTASDPKLFEKNLKNIKQDVQKFGLALSQTDLDTIVKIYRAFYSAGLDIRYSSYHRPPRSIYPT